MALHRHVDVARPGTGHTKGATTIRHHERGTTISTITTKKNTTSSTNTAAPNASRPATAAAERQACTAAALLLTSAELAELRKRLRAADSDCGLPREVARRLGVTAGELDRLRKVLRNSGAGSTALDRATARLIISTTPRRGPAVYVVGSSRVYHRTIGCGSAANARRRQMTEREAKRNGRRVCEHCRYESDAPVREPIRESTVLVDGPDTPRVTPAVPKASRTAAKRQRAVAEAARRGITVEQLKAERRAEQHRNVRLKQRAVRLGVTTAQLRKLIAAGVEPAER